MIALLLQLSLGLVLAQDAKTAPRPAPEPTTAVKEAAAVDPYTAVSASLVVKVGKPDEATDALVAAADELGGWFQSRTRDQVALRVPVAQVEALLERAEALGKVTDRATAREDLTLATVDARSKLEVREEVLDRYYEVLETADPSSVVGVERQIVSAIEQIERLQGRIRVLEDRAAYARVDVAFRFRDRRAPTRDGSSNFPWLNTLNVVDVLYGLQAASPDWKVRGANPVAPDGFSPWRKQRRFRAASPDGVLFRVRTEKHKPEATPEFWREAVRERMVAAGYKVVAEQETPSGGVLELVSPMGQEDWTYAVAFAVDGRKLHVAEAAGEVTRFEARRAEIEQALTASVAP